MNKNFIFIALIFIVPLAVYWGLTRDKLAVLPAVASSGDCVIKFSSPMCYECQELEKVLNEVYPKYNKDVQLIVVDIANRDKKVQRLIREYKVTLVPTTVFKNQDGRVLRRIEGTMEPNILDNYLKELVNE